MKRMLALVLTLVLVLSITQAFALDLVSKADFYPIDTDITVTYYDEGGTRPHEKFASWKESPFHTGLSEMTGIGIDWIYPPTTGSGAERTFTNTLLADPTGLPNIMMGYFMGDAEIMLEDEVIWDLTPYIQEYAPAFYAFLQTNPVYDRALKTNDGKYYAFGFFREDGGWNDTYLGPVVRTDWLEECGLEEPATISEFENVVRVFNEKYGAKLSFSFSRVNTSGVSGAFGAYGASDATWFIKEDGKVGLAQAEPEWRAYLSWLNKLWDEGLLDQDFLSLDDTSIKGKIHNDMTGISITSMGQLNNWNKETEAAGKEPVWKAVQYPKGDDGTLSMVFGGPGIGTHTAVITKTADEETMKVALQLLDYAYTKEGFLYWNFGKEGVSWEYDAEGKVKLTALVTEDKDTDPLVKYGGATWGANCIQATQLLYLKNSPISIEANDLWFYPNQDVSSHWKWPVGITFTLEDADELKLIGSSITTYCPEMFAAFVTGNQDVNDDAVWNKHLETLKAYSMDRILEIRQGAYDLYLAR